MYLDNNVILEVIKAKQLEPGDIIIVSAPPSSKIHTRDAVYRIEKFFKPHKVKVLFSYPEIKFDIVKG